MIIWLNTAWDELGKLESSPEAKEWIISGLCAALEDSVSINKQKAIGSSIFVWIVHNIFHVIIHPIRYDDDKIFEIRPRQIKNNGVSKIRLVKAYSIQSSA